MHKPIKYVEKAFAVTADAAWTLFDKTERDLAQPWVRAELVG